MALYSPTDFGFWLSDTKSAYEEAKNKYEEKLLYIIEINELYKVAPLIAAARRHIENEATIREMVEFTAENVEYDFSVDPASKNRYQFQFVIAYIHSHVPPGIFTEMEGDRIMDYLNDQWDLFENA